MTEKSWPWSTVAALGDGAAELNEALSREFLATYFLVQNPALEGVSKGVLGELAVTGAASPLAVAAGSAVCYGLYINDAVVNPTVATPAVGTTGGRVVLQTNWGGTGGAGLEARTRIAVKKSADGVSAIPALTQNFGTTWEVSLATFTITTGGVITVTDARVFRRATGVVGAAEIEDLIVGTAEIADLSVTSGKLAALAVVAGKIADGAVDTAARIANGIITTAKIAALQITTALINDLAVTTGKIADLAVTTAKMALLSVTTGVINDLAVTLGKLANDSVDDTKAGNRVPQFYRRQGGSATNWSTAGTTERTPGAVRMQAGVVAPGLMVEEAEIWPNDRVTITFPVAFSDVPLILAGPIYWGTNPQTMGDKPPWEDDNTFLDVPSWPIYWIDNQTAAGFRLNVIDFGSGAGAFSVPWLAIGPE